jgi:hypothetical protein
MKGPGLGLLPCAPVDTVPPGEGPAGRQVFNTEHAVALCGDLREGLAVGRQQAVEQRDPFEVVVTAEHGRALRVVWLRFGLVLAGLVLVQLPFLVADADRGLRFSRGPFTDEGLYTGQVRNAMVTGHLDLGETDGVVKEPLFSGVAWVVLHVDDSMPAMRLAVVLACAAAFAWMAAGRGAFARLLRVAIPVGLLSYFPFQYGHLALAEMPCTVAVLASLAVVHRRLSGGGRWTVVVSGFLVFLAYGLKVQFVYAAAVPVLAFALALLARRIGGLPVRRRDWADFASSAGVAAAFLAVYFTVWVLPNFDRLSALNKQVDGRTSGLGGIPRVVLRNLRVTMGEHGVWPLLLLFIVGVVAALRAWGAGDEDARTQWIALVVPPLAWLAVEAHKFTLSYLPSRYLVSTLTTIALLGAAGVVTLGKPLPAWRRSVAGALGLAMLGAAVAANGVLYLRTLGARQYALHDTQTSLAANGRRRGKLVMGPWAGSLFWGTGAVTKPIWRGLYNDTDIINRFHPAAIVTEPNQEDSAQALTDDGIILPGKPEQTFRVAAWTVELYSAVSWTMRRSPRERSAISSGMRG